MNIGCIGTGNMGRAIINGIAKNRLETKEHIFASAKNKEKLDRFCAELGINAAANNTEVARNSDVLLLAIKPNMFSTVLPEIAATVQKKKPLVISVAAGTDLEKIARLLATSDIPVIRAMPNVNSSIGEGMTALCANAFVTQEHLQVAQNIFDGIGKTILIDEKYFSIFSAVAGASPAFTFMYIEALAKAGLKEGLSKKEALMAAAQAVLGSAKLVLESGEHPLALADKVCSPGGTTIAGVAALEENAFTGTVIKAVMATTQKDEELLSKTE